MRANIFGGPLGKTFCVVSAVVLGLLALIDDLVLIHFLNIIVMALSGGAAVAYLPVARIAYFHPHPRPVHTFAFGAFCISLGLFLSRLVAISVRTHWGNWLRDSDAVSLFLFLILVGVVVQFNAHRVEEGVLPPAQWRRFGLVVAASIFAAAMFWYWNNWVTII